MKVYHFVRQGGAPQPFSDIRAVFFAYLGQLGESFEFFDSADEKCLPADFEFAAENHIAILLCRSGLMLPTRKIKNFFIKNMQYSQNYLTFI